MTPQTLLLRQAHPNFMAGSIITSQVFMLSSSDNGYLSVYDGDLISATDSYTHYKGLGNQSHSVWAVTKAETDSQAVPAGPDPLADNPAHAKIDFTAHTERACRRIAKLLKELAIKRGCQHP